LEHIDSTVEYSLDYDTFNVCGTGLPVHLNPGENMYFRRKATDSSFYSEIQSLIVKPRPETPQFSIDFLYEQTMEPVDSGIEYSTQEDYLNATSGTGLPVKVNPGENLYFRSRSTDSTFISLSSFLEIPQRPLLVYSGKDTIDKAVIEIKATLPANITGLDPSKIKVTNGYVQNLSEEDLIDIIPQKTGDVGVFIPPNAFNSASFASNKIKVFFKDPGEGFAELEEEEISVYPVPSYDGLVHIYFTNPGYFKVELFSLAGRMILEKMVYGDGLETIKLSDLKGVYFLWIASENAQTSRKIVLY
jgi:hypothetical protein